VRIRLLLAAVCILSLPFGFSASPGHRLVNSAPFATVAFAGHTTSGGWCENGSPGCITDDPGGNGMVFAESTQNMPVDLGSGTLLILAVLLVMLRYKA
jgi:hypothetical protein